MKWNKLGRAALGATVSMALAFATACSRDYSVAYLYSTSAGTQTVGAFAIDYQTGVLTQIAGSPFSGVGRNPVALVAAPNQKFIYVLSHDDSTVAQFGVGTDGKLYGLHTYNLTGSFGTSIAVDPAGKYLYVTYTYQNGYTTASPGPGGLTIFPINSDNSLGSAINVNLGNNPVSVAVSSITTTFPNTFVYVVDQEASPNATVLGFQQSSSGALTTLSGTTCTAGTVNTPSTCKGYAAGTVPSSIAVDPTTRFVYVSDQYANQIISYGISATSTGNLIPLVTSPTLTGSFPVNMIIDPRGKYLLVANFNSHAIASYTINTADGSLGGTSSLGSATVATGPSCVTIDPALGIYVYSSNRLDNSISGLQMSPNTGGLSGIPNSPFPTSTLPSCVVAVASGSRSQSIVNP